MIAAARELLVSTLRELAVPVVHTHADDLAARQGPLWAAVLLRDDRLERDGSRVARTGAGYRRRVFRRTVTFEVTVAARTVEQAEQLVSGLLSRLPSRIDDGEGNAVRVSAGSASREEDRSLLAERAACRVDIEFQGGVYRDEPVALFRPSSCTLALEAETGA